MFEPIYQQGVRDWLRVLDDMSPILAHRLRSGRLTVAHALNMIGVRTGAFDAPIQCDHLHATPIGQGDLFERDTKSLNHRDYE